MYCFLPQSRRYFEVASPSLNTCDVDAAHDLRIYSDASAGFEQVLVGCHSAVLLATYRKRRQARGWIDDGC